MTRQGATPSIDMDKAMLDPGSVFSTPEEVVRHTGLTREQKVEILRRWEYDAAEVAVAVEEGMPDGESDLLRRILVALESLGYRIDAEHAGPTKQHGLPRPSKKSG